MRRNEPKIEKISAAKFQAKCLPILDEVHSKRHPVPVTKRGKPLAKIAPAAPEKDEIFGFYKGKGKILGDVVAPALTPEEWGSLYPD